MFDILNTKIHEDNIIKKREEVRGLFILESENIKDNTISSISVSDLKLMLNLYDQVFFENWFKDYFKGKLKFSFSRRMTKSAGSSHFPKNIDNMKPEEVVIDIRIGIEFFFNYDSIEGNKTVAGINTRDSLEALQLVFEHELCHVIEFIHFKRTNCSGKRFKMLAGNIFGHTESYHKLPTNGQIACQKLGLKIGDVVSFDFKGKKLSGILYSIKKRAVVMVLSKDGLLIDNQGNRYVKYYVPLNLLE